MSSYIQDKDNPSIKRAVSHSNQIPAYLNGSDSDDDNSFQPPALSDYALALLEREQKENIQPASNKLDNVAQIHKRVNFRPSPIFSGNPGNPEHGGLSTNNNNNNNSNNTLLTNQSEYETIFTKNVSRADSYNSSPGSNPHAEKTPLSKLENTSLTSSNNSNSLRTRNSIRRTRLSSALGPPKRGTFAIKSEHSLNNEMTTPNRVQVEEDTPMKDAVDSPQKKSFHLRPTESQMNVGKFDFENLNPYQYSKKYNLSSSDLPKLVKLYFEQQKKEVKESLNSPVRLKEALHYKMEEELRQFLSPKFSPKPKRELFKDEKQSSRTINIYSDKENQNQNQNEKFKSLNSNIDRPKSRPPLQQIQEARNQNYQSSMISSKQSPYYEHHYKQVQKLKDPDDYSRSSSSRLITINDKQYEKLELLGKGGSSKVFKVKSLTNKVYAVKKISFDEFDDSSIKGFKGEIDLLTKLRDQDRVVRLIDYSLGQGSLLLVMECGDIDLSHVLSKRLDLPLDVEFVRFHSNEILKCVKAVHDAGIVHSDLKPANFLFVKGMLKIIDFGIANAVPEHTMNIYRESQIGTPNYMAPEALIDNNQHLADTSKHKSTWRVGKPSDIWSCGCIMYQMIYGRPPYGGYQGSQRLLAIMNPDIKIVYPEKGLGGVKVPGTAIETIKSCLIRDPSHRWTAEQVLQGSFLKPRVVSEQFINDLVKNAITYGVSKSLIEEDELKALAEDVWKRVSQLGL